jgi:hypothetical protein
MNSDFCRGYHNPLMPYSAISVSLASFPVLTKDNLFENTMDWLIPPFAGMLYAPATGVFTGMAAHCPAASCP